MSIITNFSSLPWMETAASLIGIHENKNESKLLQWAEYIGLDNIYTSGDIAWCGLFVAYCMADNGIEPVIDPLWARNWIKFGTKLSNPEYGCILVFSRGSGGHVGFYVSEDDNTFHVLGGNQSDAVNITKVDKSRILSYNFPTAFLSRRTDKRLYKTFNGEISTDES